MGEAAQTRTPETQLFRDVFNASPLGIAVENFDGHAGSSQLGDDGPEMRGGTVDEGDVALGDRVAGDEGRGLRRHHDPAASQSPAVSGFLRCDVDHAGPAEGIQAGQAAVCHARSLRIGAGRSLRSQAAAVARGAR